MVNDAEKFKDQDQARKEAIEQTNKADQLCNDTEKSMTEFGDKLDKTEADAVKSLISDLRELVVKVNGGETVEVADIKGKYEELQKASLKLFENMYKNQQANESKDEEKK